MTRIETTLAIMKFLELNLSQEGLTFFLNVKKSFGADEELFYDFVTAYLTIQKGGIMPLEDKVYTDFVIYFTQFSQIQGEKKLLEQFARYAKYFLMLKLEYVDNDDFQRSISVINSYEAADVYPFLMEVLDDFENDRIDNSALIGMLNMVEELVFKRHQSGDNTSLSSLGIDINKMLYGTNDTRSVI